MTGTGPTPISRRRQARAMLLPFAAAILIPAAILLLGPEPHPGLGLGWAGALLIYLLGLAFLAAGFGLWLRTVRLFARVGEGTLAPWDPTANLVAVGPYRYVRNPMITAVLAAIVGEALVLGSAALAAWALLFFLINWAYFVLVEEPQLERRFGEPYRRYREEVPRWIPRARRRVG